MRVVATCDCTSTVLLRAREIVCAACGAPIVAGGETATLYTTEAPDWPPLARSRRHARDLIKRVPGHERLGAGANTLWRVSREAYHAHHARRPTLRLVSPPTASDEAALEAAKAEWAHRATRAS